MSPFYRCRRCAAESTLADPPALVCKRVTHECSCGRRHRYYCGGQLVLTAVTPAVAAGGA